MTTIPDDVARDIAAYLRGRCSLPIGTDWVDALDPKPLTLRDKAAAALFAAFPQALDDHEDFLPEVDVILAVVRAEIEAMPTQQYSDQMYRANTVVNYKLILALFDGVS